ncbi:DEAD/DEAH box helicase [Spirosoma taeanense]|uniref:DEAD/DEAH box helicase n=1 Tax=Spirosoma taeanense TaxID=2735870 RepID=A0A6M5Y9F7_9BACT|nr:DEAD/DEAH box helicase [Spirosoma taeanense]QJW90898.1 DEAD/DEAH box helicase [Spirosoma taeanense]
MITPEQQDQILANLGIAALNPMQEAAQSAILQDTDLFLIAPTGSGKTLGFLLPVLQLLTPEQNAVQCLILTPSRELALQIEQVWKKMATGYKVNVCYGGHSMETEIKNLSNPPALLIGTPGRITDHISRQTFALDGIHTLVLDEFDKSLTLGFHEEMAFIIEQLQNLSKRVLVSATAGISIPEFIRLNRPVRLVFNASDDAPGGLTLKLVHSEAKDKIDTLIQLLCSLHSEPALIFCNHRDAAERTSTLLGEHGIHSLVYHGGLEQDARERALIQFRNGSVRYLITTDLAARGLDIPEMKHVIHYHLPAHEHEFTHRNGRTARMQASGTAYVILHATDPRPHWLPDSLDKLLLPSDQPLPEPPEFQTLYISGGRKNKLNKVDIVGFLSQKGKLGPGDLGLIEVKDFMSFAAVKTGKVPALLTQIRDEKMKGKKYKIEVAR